MLKHETDVSEPVENTKKCKIKYIVTERASLISDEDSDEDEVEEYDEEAKDELFPITNETEIQI